MFSSLMQSLMGSILFYLPTFQSSWIGRVLEICVKKEGLELFTRSYLVGSYLVSFMKL